MQFPHCLSSTVSVCDIPFGTKPYIFLQCLQCHLPQFQVNDVPADPTCYQQLCQVFEGHHQLLFPLKYKTKLRVNQLKITSLLVNYFDPVPILQSLIANDFLSRGGEGGGRGGEEYRLFCNARDSPSDIALQDARFVIWWTWWSWEQATHPATQWIVLNDSPSSTPQLCLYLANCGLPPASWGFTRHIYLQVMFVLNI